MPSAFFSPILFHRYFPYSGSCRYRPYHPPMQDRSHAYCHAHGEDAPFREVVAVVVHRDVFHQVVEVVACAHPRTPLATGGEVNPLA